MKGRELAAGADGRPAAAVGRKGVVPGKGSRGKGAMAADRVEASGPGRLLLAAFAEGVVGSFCREVRLGASREPRGRRA
jgi:hypothetical protein